MTHLPCCILQLDRVKQGPASAFRRLNMALRLLQGSVPMLAHLHSQGCVHRDIKPSNLMVSKGRLQVLDLGIASPIGTIPLIPGGSLEYIPPLQLLDLKGCASPSQDW